MQSTNGTPERPVGEVEEQILHILGICEPNDHKPCWWEDDRPDDRDHLEHGQYGAIIALLATATRTAVEEARVAVERLDARTSKVEYISEPITFGYRDPVYAKEHKDFLSGVYAGYSAAKQDAIAALTQRGEGGGSEQASI